MKNLFVFHNQSHYQNVQPLYIAFSLFILGILVYSNSIFHPFVHDDITYIQNNPYIGQLDAQSIFTSTSTPDQKHPLINTYYRPALEMYNRFIYRIFGLNPHAYHFFNVLIHIINSILVYALVSVFTSNKKGFSFFMAIVFLLHPVQTEAVACISGVSNLMSIFFILMGFSCYIISRLQEEKRSFYIYSLIFFFLGLLSKEQTVVYPFLILLYELLFLRRGAGQKNIAWSKIGGIFSVFIFYVALRYALIGLRAPSIFENMGEFKLRLMAIPQSLMSYFSVIFLPIDLHYYRSIDILNSPVTALLGCAFIAFLMIWMIRMVPKGTQTLMIFGLGWFIISIFPTLNIVPLVIEYSYIMASEHFLYLPLIGIILFFSSFVYTFIERIRKPILNQLVSAGLAILILIYSGLTMAQNRVYSGEVPLFERSLKYEPHLSRVHILLAKAYFDEGRIYEAIDKGNQAIRILRRYIRKINSPSAANFYYGLIKGTHFDLAHFYSALGLTKEVIEEYKKALEVDPYDGVLYYNLGLVYLQTREFDGALKAFEKAVALNERDVNSLNNLAVLYIKKGEREKAKQRLIKVLKLDKNNFAANQNWHKLQLEELQP